MHTAADGAALAAHDGEALPKVATDRLAELLKAGLDASQDALSKEGDGHVCRRVLRVRGILWGDRELRRRGGNFIEM